MLEQVMIEAAIFEVTLGDDLRHGVDWLYRSDNDDKVGAWDGQNLLSPSNSIQSVAAGALTYYQNITGINTEIAINLAAVSGKNEMCDMRLSHSFKTHFYNKII